MLLRFNESLGLRYSSISGCANKETNASTSSSNFIISCDMMIDGDCSYNVLRCASKTRQMFRTAVTVPVHGGTLICKAQVDQHTLSYTTVDPL